MEEEGQWCCCHKEENWQGLEVTGASVRLCQRQPAAPEREQKAAGVSRASGISLLPFYVDQHTHFPFNVFYIQGSP